MNYCKLFDEHAGDQVKVVMTDGEIFTGKLTLYISAADNEPEPESIAVNNTELYTNEIAEVIILD